MAFMRWNGRALDGAGNLILAPTVSVRRMTTGRPRQPIFRDETGATQLPNPWTLDPSTDAGRIAFHCAGGFYEIRITSTAHPNFEEVYEWEPIGELQSFDYGDAGLLSFDWDAVVATISGRDAHDGESKGFSVLVESDEGRDDLPVVYYKLSGADADWSNGLVFPAVRMKAAVSFTLDALGNVIATGPAEDQPVPFPCQITGWSILADGVGSIEIDLWKSTFAAFPPTVASSLTGGNPPQLTASARAEDFVLDNWDTMLSGTDYLRLNVNSCSGITRAKLTLFLRRI